MKQIISPDWIFQVCRRLGAWEKVYLFVCVCVFLLNIKFEHSPVCYTLLHSPSTCTQRRGWRHCPLLRAHWPLAPSPPCLELHLPVSWPPLDRSSQPALRENKVNRSIVVKKKLVSKFVCVLVNHKKKLYYTSAQNFILLKYTDKNMLELSVKIGHNWLPKTN